MNPELDLQLHRSNKHKHILSLLDQAKSVQLAEDRSREQISKSKTFYGEKDQQIEKEDQLRRTERIQRQKKDIKEYLNWVKNLEKDQDPKKMQQPQQERNQEKIIKLEQEKEEINQQELRRSQQIQENKEEQLNQEKQNELESKHQEIKVPVKNDLEEKEEEKIIQGQKNINVEEKQYKNKEQQEKIDKESKQSKKSIKEAIDKLTSNILISKQSIIEDIQSINEYAEQAKKSSYQVKKGIRFQLKKKKKEKDLQEQRYQAYLREQQELIKAEEKKKQRERKRKILIEQRIMKKQRRQEEERLEQRKINERIQIQSKFTGKKQSHPPLSEQQMKQFEQEYISRIKQRLNMFKKQDKATTVITKSRSQPIIKNQLIMKKMKQKKKKEKSTKFVEKILLNFKLKSQLQSYIPSQSKLESIEESQLSERQQIRQHRSAPNSLPKIPEKRLRSHRIWH